MVTSEDTQPTSEPDKAPIPLKESKDLPTDTGPTQEGKKQKTKQKQKNKKENNSYFSQYKDQAKEGYKSYCAVKGYPPDHKLSKEDIKEIRKVIQKEMKKAYGISIAPPSWMIKRAARMCDIPVEGKKNKNNQSQSDNTTENITATPDSPAVEQPKMKKDAPSLEISSLDGPASKPEDKFSSNQLKRQAKEGYQTVCAAKGYPPDHKLSKEDVKEIRKEIQKEMKKAYGISIAPPSWMIRKAARMCDIPVEGDKNKNKEIVKKTVKPVKHEKTKPIEEVNKQQIDPGKVSLNQEPVQATPNPPDNGLRAEGSSTTELKTKDPLQQLPPSQGELLNPGTVSASASTDHADPLEGEFSQLGRGGDAQQFDKLKIASSQPAGPSLNAHQEPAMGAKNPSALGASLMEKATSTKLKIEDSDK